MPSFREVLKPTVSLSVLVLGLSLAGQLNVMRPPPLPKMYVVPAKQNKEKHELENKDLLTVDIFTKCCKLCRGSFEQEVEVT